MNNELDTLELNIREVLKQLNQSLIVTTNIITYRDIETQIRTYTDVLNAISTLKKQADKEMNTVEPKRDKKVLNEDK